jgi:hypothetical protein
MHVANYKNDCTQFPGLGLSDSQSQRASHVHVCASALEPLGAILFYYLFFLVFFPHISLRSLSGTQLALAGLAHCISKSDAIGNTTRSSYRV